MFFCKSIIPWELPRTSVQDYESTGLTNTGHNAWSDLFGPAARDHAEKPPRSMSPTTAIFVQVFILHGLARQRLAGVVNPLRKRISRSRDPQSKATHPSDPSWAPFVELPSQLRTPLRGHARGVGHPKRQLSPKWAALNLDRSRSVSRPPEGGPARDDNVFGLSESVTPRIKRERNRGNGKFLPPHSN
jgi:hypothetical protein